MAVYSNLLVVLVLQVMVFRYHVTECLTITNYGSLQISMLKHGEKYATDRPCYAWEDVMPWYHGMVHIRGTNDKVGEMRFNVDCPVKIFLAVDTRYLYSHGDDFAATTDYLYLGGCHKPRVKFQIYESKQTWGAGIIPIIHSPFNRMVGIFLRDSRVIQPYARLHVTSLPPSWTFGMVREGEKFSTNRPCYAMEDVLPKYYGLLHLRGPNDKRSVRFTVNIPTIVYVAIDSRYPSPLDPAQYKAITDEKIVHGGCHPRTDFNIYYRRIAIPGEVTINLSAARMLAIFLKPADVDNTFKAGVY